MEYEQYRGLKEALQLEVSQTSKAMRAFPRGPMGLTPDDVRASAEYQDARRKSDTAFERLRKFNGTYVKQFKRQDALALEEKRRLISERSV